MVRIAVLANCQGQDLLTLITALAGRRSDIVVRHILNYVPSTTEEDEFIANATHVAYQATWNRQSFQKRNPGQVVIYFPGLRLNCLYPFAGVAHPLNYGSRTKYMPGGPFDDQLGDKRLNQIMSEYQDASPSEMYERYISLDYAKLIDLDEVWERDRTRLDRLGEISNLDMTSLIEVGFRLRPLFWTNLHPVIDLLRYCYMHVLMQLPLDVPLSATHAKIAVIHDSLNTNHSPVHPSIGKHFGLGWADCKFPYRQWLAGSFDHREWTLRYIRFDHTPALAKARVDVIQTVDVADAVSVLEQEVASGRAGGQVYHLLSIGYWKLQRMDAAQQAALRAIDCEPLETRFQDFLATLLRLG